MQQSRTRQILGLSIPTAYTCQWSKTWDTKLENCFCNFSTTAGRLRHGLGKNRELFSSVSRIKRDTTTVHLTDRCRFPATLVREGFRTKRNTVRSLYRLHLSLERAKSSKLPTALLNIDLEKAFDSVWISGLLYKLRNYNIAGRMFRLLEAFLRNRHVFIELGEYKSHIFLVNMAVPQGACFLRYFLSYFSMTSW